MAESIQHVLTRVRPPRVKITYDVETGGAIEKTELPFIVGIFADLSGDGKDSLEPVKKRKLVDIDRDNFDEVLASCNPTVKLAGLADVLPNPPANNELVGEIKFKCFDDFNPMALLKMPDDVDKATYTPTRLQAIYAERGNLRAFQAKSEATDTMAQLAELAVTSDDDASIDLDTVDAQGAKTTTTIKAGALRTELTAAFPADASKWKDAEDKDTLKIMFDAMLMGDDRQDADRLAGAKNMIGQFVNDIVAKLPAGNTVVAGKLMDQRVCQIDRAIGRQLDIILHSDGFQQIEASWRGLHYLVFKAETGKSLKLRVMNIDKDKLREDMEKAAEFDQSHIFKLIYEAEYDTYGGFPYSLLIGDYEFGRKGTDSVLLNKMAQVAAASHAPFIASPRARLFDLISFDDLARPRDLSKIFESIELAEWSSFRESEDSRYVTLAMPKVLLRTPYGENTVPLDGIVYEENVDRDPDPAPAIADLYSKDVTECGWDDKTAAEQAKLRIPRAKDSRKFLWGNAAYVLAERITHAFSLYSWCAAIRGVRGGGLVEDLPVYTYKTAEGDVTMTCPTQVTITDRREKELNDLGFMAICHCKGTNKAAFFGGQTTNLPKKYFSASANANAKLSAMLPYMLAASRFAHYIKVIMRERIGSFMTRANVESFLNDWISNYVLLDDNAPQEIKAAFPLREAKVIVTEDAANPGSYAATVFLKPHFQLEELDTSIRLVANLPG